MKRIMEQLIDSMIKGNSIEVYSMRGNEMVRLKTLSIHLNVIQYVHF